ncbi:hypothetical protein EDB85DRAFT_1873869 [Lactarius pseudohatsudake]|nr:hypothetical protein EDB85DRAFT_1873869 [Lactarius pseudohatsudake]
MALSFITSPANSLKPDSNFGYRGYTSPLSAMSKGKLYLCFACAMGLLPPADRFMQVVTEDAVLNLFQNVLFSVAHFCKLTGAYPAHITVVSHNFKQHHFGQLHQHALCWPKLHSTYGGIPLGTEADERQVALGEIGIFSCKVRIPCAPL